MQTLTPDLLLYAYASGLFPMANDRDDPSIYWIEPRRRGILPLDEFHASKSLRKVIRQGRFEIMVDQMFPAVIDACAGPAPDRPRTWLNDELIRLYVELFGRGYAHSVETWREGRLVGGLYGVALGAAFFGESMFSRERDASKVALAALIDILRAGGFQLLDTQFITDHLRQFGTVEVSRTAYQRLLKRALQQPAVFQGLPGGGESNAAWPLPVGGIGSSQSTTQRS